MYHDRYNTNDRKFHNLKYIEKVADVPADVNVEHSHKDGSTMGSSTTVYSISDLFSLVKKYDKNFHPKPVNKLLLNEDGTPKVF